MAYGNRRFNAAFTRTLQQPQQPLSWAESTQFLVLIPISLRYILIMSSHLSLDLPKGLSVRILEELLPSSILPTWLFLGKYLLWALFHFMEIQSISSIIFLKPAMQNLRITIIYLHYDTTAPEGIWPPNNEGFFIWLNFSYTYILPRRMGDNSIASWDNYIGTKVLLGREYAD